MSINNSMVGLNVIISDFKSKIYADPMNSILRFKFYMPQMCDQLMFFLLLNGKTS